MKRSGVNSGRRTRFRIAGALLILILAAAFTALGLLLRDTPDAARARPQAAPIKPISCTAAGFPAKDFGGCLRRDFNDEQKGRKNSERLVETQCTELTESLAKASREELQPGYRYFGCHLVFNQDGAADAVLTWREAPSFRGGVTIERIKWEEGEAGLVTP